MRRIHIVGDSDAAHGLRTLIAQSPILRTARWFSDIAITVEDYDGATLEIDSIDNPFERLVLTHIRRVTLPTGGRAHTVGISIPATHTTDSARTDRMRIRIPRQHEHEAYAVEHGVYRALLDTARPSASRRWWSRRQDNG